MGRKEHQLILLDWDGNILDTLNVWVKVFQKALSEYDIQASELDIIRHAFNDFYGPVKLGFPVEKLDQYERKVRDLAKEMLKEAELFPQVKDTLIELKQRRKKLVVVTNSAREVVEYYIYKHGIMPYLDGVITLDDVTNGKPDPEGVNKAMADLSISPDQTMIVGDSDKDILAGKAAGITTVAHYPAENKLFYDEDLVAAYNADHIIVDFKELLNLT